METGREAVREGKEKKSGDGARVVLANGLEAAGTQAELRVRALNFGLVYPRHGKLYLGLSSSRVPASREIILRRGMASASDRIL